MSAFINNLTAVLKNKNISQKSIADAVGLTEGAISMWKKGRVPSKNRLRLLASYLSRELNIPYKLFQNGQSLITKDFSKILAKRERDLQASNAYASNEPTSPKKTDGNQSVGLKSFAYEDFIAQLRNIYNKHVLGIEDVSLHRDISPATLSLIIEYFQTIKFDIEYLRGTISNIKALLRYRDDSGKRSKDAEDDSRDNKM